MKPTLRAGYLCRILPHRVDGADSGIFRLLLGTRRPAFAEGVIRAGALIGVSTIANPGIVSWFVFTIFAGAPEIQPQSLGHPSLWRGRFEPIRLIHVGREARKAPVDAVVFFLDSPSYRTYQELAFRVCDHHGFAE